MILLLVLLVSAQTEKNLSEKAEKRAVNSSGASAVAPKASPLSLKRRISSDVKPTIGTSNALERFSLMPASTSNFSMSYQSTGKDNFYVASYLHNLTYQLGKYGNLGVSFQAGKYGGSSVDATYFLKPHINYEYSTGNFNFLIHIDAPSIEKKEGFQNPIGN